MLDSIGRTIVAGDVIVFPDVHEDEEALILAGVLIMAVVQDIDPEEEMMLICKCLASFPGESEWVDLIGVQDARNTLQVVVITESLQAFNKELLERALKISEESRNDDEILF